MQKRKWNKKTEERMRKKYKKTGWKSVLFSLTCLCLIVLNVQNIWAYDYQMTGAYQDGTVTITALSGTKSANGYSSPGGYRVDYSLTKDFIAFQEFDGCDFYIGNNLNPSGGCQFAYKPNGVIWEQGALNLGAIYDGRGVGSAKPDANNTVSVSFTVSDLSELPNYICYTYQPAGGAYIHISDTYGHNHHVWYYQSLKNVIAGNEGSIDKTAPTLRLAVLPGGTTSIVNGKTWGTKAVIQATASDSQSRPGQIVFYKNGSEVHTFKNTANGINVTENYAVTENGTYQVKAYDQLGNTGAMNSVTVDCIDTTAPVISSIKEDTTDFCTNTILTVEASDRECGLHEAAYSFNNGDWTSDNTYSITANGTYTVRVRDHVGNIASKSIVISNIDLDKPDLQTDILPEGETVTVGGVLWTKGKHIHIKACDAGAGMAKVELKKENDQKAVCFNPENKGQKEMCIDTASLLSGKYEVIAYDILNNVQKSIVTITCVDSDAPHIRSITQKTVDEKTVRVTVVADDGAGSGLQNKAYSFDGGKTWQESNYLDVNKNDIYTIVVRDFMGLTAQKKEAVESIKTKQDNSDDSKDDSKNDKTDDKTDASVTNQDQKDDTGTKNDGEKKATSDIGNDKDKKGNKSDSVNRDKEKEKKTYDDFHEEDVSKLENKNTLDDETNRFVKKMEEKLKNREIDTSILEDDSEKKAKEEKKVKRIAAAFLAFVLIAGLLALGFYCYLALMHDSCVLYAVGEHNERKKLARIPLKSMEEDWLVEVPDHKLGDFGTGHYLVVFKTSFVKENEGDYVVIVIDKNRVREKLREEIEVRIL